MKLPTWNELITRYETVDTELALARRTITLTQVHDINAIVDAMTPEDFGPDERLPYWAILWSAARDLAEHLLGQKNLGRTIELGAGLGLGSIAAALAGARVLATDYEPDALGFIQHNAAQNGVTIDVQLLDWRELGGVTSRFDTIIASDVLYEARNVLPLADAIAHLIAPSGRALVSDPGRPHFPQLRDELRERGFQVGEIAFGKSKGLEARPAFTPSPA